MKWPPGTVLNAAGRPRDLWRKWPDCCRRLYYTTLLASLMENPHAPARPAICPVHGEDAPSGNADVQPTIDGTQVETAETLVEHPGGTVGDGAAPMPDGATIEVEAPPAVPACGSKGIYTLKTRCKIYQPSGACYTGCTDERTVQPQPGVTACEAPGLPQFNGIVTCVRTCADCP